MWTEISHMSLIYLSIHLPWIVHLRSNMSILCKKHPEGRSNMTLVGLNYLQHQEAVKKRKQDREIADRDRSSKENIASLDRTSRQEISAADRSSREDIARADRIARIDIADKDRAQSRELKRIDQIETEKHNDEMERVAKQDLEVKRGRALVQNLKDTGAAARDYTSAFKNLFNYSFLD